MYEKEEEKLELERGKYRLSSIIGGNREMDQLYTTSQVSIQFLSPVKLLIIEIILE